MKWAAALWHCCSSLRRFEAVMMAWAAAGGTVASSCACAAQRHLFAIHFAIDAAILGGRSR